MSDHLLSLRRLLFPAAPRSFPGRRGVKIVLRAVHVLCAGVLTGATLFAVEPAQTGVWFVATALSGCAILVIDLHESAAFLFQVRGLLVLAKVTSFLLLIHFGALRGWILGCIVMVSVIFSHAPGKVRYHMVIGRGWVEPSRSPG